MTEDAIHRTRIAIRWGDMDALGHVNNTVFFRYIEQARIEWLESVGSAVKPVGQGPVVVNAHCSFLKQLKYPGEIEVTSLPGPPGRASFELMHQIRRVDDLRTLCAEGGAKVVWVDFALEKAVPLPGWLREKLVGGG